jgi:hypothetical protein
MSEELEQLLKNLKLRRMLEIAYREKRLFLWPLVLPAADVWSRAHPVHREK